MSGMIRSARPLIDAAATGAWATRARLRAYPSLLVGAYALAALALVLTGRGIVDAAGRPIGADFGMVWSAGKTALAGRPAEAFSLAVQAQNQEALFGPAAGFTPWLYPPTYLLIAAPLAALPYLAALAVWLAATFSLYLAAIRMCLDDKAPHPGAALLLAAAFPAAFINAAHGQNGFLTAGLMTMGVLLLRRRPVIAGFLLGLLTYKPQFCVLIPFLLIAEANWRALAASFFSAGALLAAALSSFRAETFKAFFAATPDARRLTIETGAAGWEKIQSVFAGVRLIGGGYESAMAVQIAVAIVVIVAVVLVWSSGADARLRQALVFPGVLLTTPYCLDYDMVVLAPALVLLGLHGMERGFARWEITLIAFVFTTPLVARLVGGATHLPLGAVATLLLFAWTLRRALADAKIRTSPVRPLPSAN